MSNTYTMGLSRPIKMGDQELSELILGDPELSALEGIDITIGGGGLKVDLGNMANLIAGAAGIPVGTARTISLRDLARHFEGIMDFFGLDTQST